MARVECFFQPEVGRIEPPSTIVAFCAESALPGVSRSLEKLAESRGWSMTHRVVHDSDEDAPAKHAPKLDTGSTMSAREYARFSRILGGGA